MNPCEFLQWCLAILVLLVIYVYWKTRESYIFWRSRNIPCRKPTFLVGDFADVLLGKKSLGEAAQDAYNEFKNKGPYAGFSMLLSPRLVVIDPDAIKNVLVKDFQHFHNHGSFHNEKDDPLSAHLFAVEGEKWRRLRVKLSPTFTSGKMKMMFGTMMESVNELEDYMDKAVSQNSVLEIKDILARFTTDIIGSCALGIQCNTLKDINAEFREIGRRIFTNKFYTVIKRSFTSSYRNLARKLKFKIVDPKVSKFFLNTIEETIKYRETNNVQRNDFLQLLMQLKNKGCLDDNEEGQDVDDKTALTLNEIAAQAFVFFIGGFETSSSTMSFCLYELALNPDIQNKCRNEINKTLEQNNGKLTYECALQMAYLDRVIYETMRKYPTIPMLPRMCSKDYILPETKTLIPKGTGVIIPVRGLHHDPSIYPEPQKFDPDRFTEEAKKTRHPFTYLPFGEGPRICIGMRFGMMQTRLGLISIIRNYNIMKSDKTSVPLKIDSRAFLTSSVGGIILNFERLGK